VNQNGLFAQKLGLKVMTFPWYWDATYTDWLFQAVIGTVYVA
jgi:hypothetical protein